MNVYITSVKANHELSLSLCSFTPKDGSPKEAKREKIREFVRFLYSSYPNFNPSDLKDFAHDLFWQEITEDEFKFVDYGKINIQSFINEMKQEEHRTGKYKRSDILPDQDGSPKEAKREKIREFEMEIQPLEVEMFVMMQSPRRIS